MSDALTALLVEDDLRLARFVTEYLTRNEVAVTHVSDGRQGLEEALRFRYDVVLLDVMLPGRDGLSICRDLRDRSDVPIVMLTARGEESDRVLGLELGADDYLAKPFSPRELLARMRAVVRRARGLAGPSAQPLQAGELSLDPGARRAVFQGRVLDLTGYEFDLLRVLAERAGRILSRDQLMELARGASDEAFDRSVDVHISHLRQKLGDDARAPRIIKTIRGAGYLYALAP